MMGEKMTADEYRTAIASLGLSQVGAARLLGVSQKTGHNYAVHGPSGPAALALRLLLTMRADERPETEDATWDATRCAIEAATWSETWAATRDATEAATRDGD